MSTLQEARSSSTRAWQDDLLSLFNNTQHRFPDVVWKFPTDPAATTAPGYASPLLEDPDNSNEEANTTKIYGHKAIVYARAPPSFQNRYFHNYGTPKPSDASQSQLSLPSPSRTPSPMPMTKEILQITTDINSTLFSGELEYLYTAKGFGEAFEFLFDSRNDSGGSAGYSGGAIGGRPPHRPDEDDDDDDDMDTVKSSGDEDVRMDKLRKDLVFMWRSRLYSDVRIALTGTFSSDNHEASTAVFSSHRFILVSRSDYFRNALMDWKQPQDSKEITLTLPSPPFTPASLHFTLGFIYTGTLVFSHRSYDLDTAFAILRSATYLALPTLEAEIQARIVQEMMHGLFHAPLEFTSYEQATGGRWGTGGCRCRQCARRAPRVLEFALADDVKNPVLDRGARRALVGLFGEGWCTSEFASLPQKTKDNLLKGVGKRTTPLNVFPLLWAAHHALQKLDRLVDVWADNVREYILAARRAVDDCLATHSEACFMQDEWNEIMENDAVRFDDGDKLEWIVGSLKRGVSEKNAAILYESVVSSILLRPQPGQPDQAFLSQSSPIRDAVDTIRSYILQYLRKRWVNVRQEGGFDDLEGWAVKEIADYIEVPLEDLLIPAPKRTTLHAHQQDTDTTSSIRVSILSKNLPQRQQADNRSMKSTVSTVRSSIRAGTAASVSARSKGRAVTPTGRRTVTPTSGNRPDSKLTPPTPKRPIPPPPDIVEPDSDDPSSNTLEDSGSVVEDEDDEDDIEGMQVKSTPSSPIPKRKPPSVSPSIRSRLGSTSSAASARQSVASSIRHQRAQLDKGKERERDRPRSSAGSVKSISSARTLKGSGGLKPPPGKTPTQPQRSTSGGATRGGAAAGASRPTSSSTRPQSSLSTHSQATSTNYHTAPSMARTRTTSTTSTVSTKSTAKSTASPATVKKTATAAATPKPRPSKSPVRSRTTSATSKTPSAVSTASTTAGKKLSTPTPTIKKKTSISTLNKPSPKQVKEEKEKIDVPPLPTPDTTPSSSQTLPLQPPTPPAKEKKASVASGVKRKTSTSTVTSVSAATAQQELPIENWEEHRGATLSVGIPCIISVSTRRKQRLRALARYIGEVRGETGAWVGVEVPNPPPSTSEDDSRAWMDGSWLGVRYFDISADPDEFASSSAAMLGSSMFGTASRGQKRGLSGTVTPDLGISKRRRGSVSETGKAPRGKGLFVRPQQVLYVVDAVDGDL